MQPNARRWAPFKVKHLAAAKTSWTRWLSLDTPAQPDSTQHTAVGMPQWNGDLSIATNDARGTYALSFDAPAPITKMTRPLRTVQYDREYRVSWNTTWAYAADWQVRARVDKGRHYGPWSNVAVPEGQRFKEVTRPFGETRCYQARAVLKDALDNTPWSKQRCVTVRR